ncbi:MAG: hypothetical protein A2086_16215 [Spirochaetes bacterium GWD1_27_9]|nr:MAG: hypothetical protein A2Z98_13860 [Spirochaetes bacterium GWB1_27_13]OHD28700.1 MAG: hypothetical protein A2086_16215 [Spirochaetes bacterium GWD1_27_9]
MRKTKYKILFLIFTFLSLSIAFSDSDSLCIVSYNTENLFDIVDNQDTTGDDEFTPTGSNKWKKEKYDSKISNIAKVITSIDKNELPDIIGLAEIENKSVLIDLSDNNQFKKEKYKIVHQESPDYRGIDTALLIKEDELEIMEYSFIPIDLSIFEKEETTREIVFAKLKILTNNEIIYVFMNHWPSRANPESYRIFTANTLRKKIDLILKNDKLAKIILLGDFNDEPTNKSLLNNLKAKLDFDINDFDLYNLMSSYLDKSQGTYYYTKEKKWNILDNIIISKGLLNSINGFVLENKKAQIFREEFILYKNSSGLYIPNKTYYGGYSDHLPVYLILKKK